MVQPNGEPMPGGNELRYDLVGDGIKITYSEVTTSDKVMTRSLHYQGPDVNHTFSGSAIRAESSEPGTLLTVTLQIILATNEETKLTLLLLPVDLLRSPEKSIDIQALAIWTKKIDPTIGPPLVGPLQTYKVCLLHGTARLFFLP